MPRSGAFGEPLPDVLMPDALIAAVPIATVDPTVAALYRTIPKASTRPSTGLRAAEVFVTADNIAAVKVYERSGYEVVDYRMFARMQS